MRWWLHLLGQVAVVGVIYASARFFAAQFEEVASVFLSGWIGGCIAQAVMTIWNNATQSAPSEPPP